MLRDVSAEELLVGLSVRSQSLLVLELDWGGVGVPRIEDVNDIHVDTS